MNYLEVIEKSKKATSHLIQNINMNEIYNAMNILKSLLKPKYSNSFYFFEENVRFQVGLDHNGNLNNLSACYFNFFKNDYVKVYGVQYFKRYFKSSTDYEWKEYNMVNEIPLAFNTNHDNDLFKLKEMINSINSKIKTELEKILYIYNNIEELQDDDTQSNLKNDYIVYHDAIKKEKENFLAQKSFVEYMNMKLSYDKNKSEEQEIVRKTKNKIEQYYGINVNKIYVANINVLYNEFKVDINCQSHDFELYEKHRTLGSLIFYENGKTKFVPKIKNEKYFTNNISSLNYMRNLFKKHILNTIFEP